jgi:hypothetical protein
LGGLGASVVLTDLKNVAERVTAPNVALNAALWGSGGKGGKCVALPLRWGCDEEETVVKTEGPYDLILCADCCYFGDVVGKAHPANPTALAASLARQCFETHAETEAEKAASSCVVLTSMEVRTAVAYEAFCAAAKLRFPVVQELSLACLPDEVLPPGYRDHHKFFLLCGGEKGLARWDAMLKKQHRRSTKAVRKEKKKAAKKTIGT